MSQTLEQTSHQLDPLPSQLDSNAPQRAINWDLLRSLAMFLVVVVHTSAKLGYVGGINLGLIVGTAAIICDPIFFTLSGFFALGPQKRSLKKYYFNKFVTILFPLLFYSILLYLVSFKPDELTIGGYFKYFTDLLKSGWWFIPALVPCLIVGPFLSKGIESLSTKSIVTLLKLFALLMLSGVVCDLFQWAFEQAGIETLSYFFSSLKRFVPPSFLTASLAYFQFFILGGLFRRVAPLIGRRKGTIIISVGIICWILDVIWAALGIPRMDPSYFWAFATFGIMVLFQRISFRKLSVCKCISWIAKRSYTIYLLQFSTIMLFVGFVYDQSIIGDVPQMNGLLRIVVWLGVTLISYISALTVASVLDPLVLNRLQSLMKSFFRNRIRE